MESYEVVEEFQQSWPFAPKNVLLKFIGKELAAFSTFLAVEDLQVYLALEVGPRGGVNETIIVIDPRPTVVADRLVAISTDGGTIGHLLPLVDVRSKVGRQHKGRRERALEVCEQAMREFVEQLNETPLKAVTLRSLPLSHDNSVKTIGAGTPSLGRNSVGTGQGI